MKKFNTFEEIKQFAKTQEFYWEYPNDDIAFINPQTGFIQYYKKDSTVNEVEGFEFISVFQTNNPDILIVYKQNNLYNLFSISKKKLLLVEDFKWMYFTYNPDLIIIDKKNRLCNLFSITEERFLFEEDYRWIDVYNTDVLVFFKQNWLCNLFSISRNRFLFEEDCKRILLTNNPEILKIEKQNGEMEEVNINELIEKLKDINNFNATIKSNLYDMARDIVLLLRQYYTYLGDKTTIQT